MQLIFIPNFAFGGYGFCLHLWKNIVCSGIGQFFIRITWEEYCSTFFKSVNPFAFNWHHSSIIDNIATLLYR